MKFSCRVKRCPRYGQEIELRGEQLIPLNLDIKQYEREAIPFFYTIPPVYCGYCGSPAWQGEWHETSS